MSTGRAGTGGRRQRVIDGTVLVTGGTSGIGAGLAARLHGRGAPVMITGRDQERLSSVTAGHPACPASRRTSPTRPPSRAAWLRWKVSQRFSPPLHRSDRRDLRGAAAAARATRSRMVHVGSGLGFVPYTQVPVYSATKAAVHSSTMSPRRQLAGSSVQVVDIIPPVVDTALHRNMPATPPMSMTVDVLLDRTVRGLDRAKDEIPIGLGRVSQIGARAAPELRSSLSNRVD